MSEPKGRGCFFYGCLTFLLVSLAVAVGVFFGTRKAIQMVVANFTDTTPAPLPQNHVPPERLRELRQRFEQLNTAAQRGVADQEFVLEGDELNAFLFDTSELKNFHDQLYFQIETNTVKAQVSLPLDQFHLWRGLSKKLVMKNLGGRYLNGVATLDVSVQNGELSVKVRDLVAKGKPLPSSFMANLRPENLAKEANKNADLQSILQKIESLEIKDGRVNMKLKTAQKAK